jgi:hypothetical protein
MGKPLDPFLVIVRMAALAEARVLGDRVGYHSLVSKV